MRYLMYACLLTVGTVSRTWAAPVAMPQDVPVDLTREQIRQANEWRDAPQSATQLPSRSFTADEIIQQPDLLESALDTAIEQHKVPHIRFLLPLYRQLESQRQNRGLIQYAQAILYRADNRHDDAENILHEMLVAHPEYVPVRLQLAITQAQNGKSREAERELLNIKQQANLPEYVLNYVERLDQQLQQNRAWQVGGKLSYLQDNNVGRVPEQRTYGGWRFSEPQSAHGVGYEASAQKTLPIKGHWAMRFQAAAVGKFYWDAHDYDDLILHSEMGAVWRDAKQELSFAPFYAKRWFATEPYSQTLGTTVRYSHSLSPKTGVFAAWQSGYKKHEVRDYLDGATHSASFTWAYRPSEWQLLTLGVGGGRSNARDASEAYRYGNFHAGWRQQWGQSRLLTTELNASVQRRVYRAADFFNIQRRDTEYWIHFAVSHPKWSWHGFVPRLNWTWSHVQSNHFYYRYQQHRVFVDVAKQF